MTRVIDSSVHSPSHEEECAHCSSFFGGMCSLCGEIVDTESAVQFAYIHKDLKITDGEIVRLQNREWKKLLHHKKLCLVLDLDHTLLHSTRKLKPDEEYLMEEINCGDDVSRGSVFKVDSVGWWTKLRPSVRSFLKEASKMFEMYIYTMGSRAYAMEMKELLDPGRTYFNSRVIAQEDCTRAHEKGLDVVLGHEKTVLILDDTESVWRKHKENLIVMQRYNFFAGSHQKAGIGFKSFSQLKVDESETEGALASILNVLRQIHSAFFDPEIGVDLSERDVRQVLRRVRKDVLKGCKVVFSRVYPRKCQAKDKVVLQKMAESMGAICSLKVGKEVTHVVSGDPTSTLSRWAVRKKKLLVNPRWIEAAYYLWSKQPEQNFTVNQMNQEKESKVLTSGDIEVTQIQA